MVPHFPYVFSSNGDYTDQYEFDYFSVKGYLDQVTYIDNQMLIILKEIINKSSTPPIIVVALMVFLMEKWEY